MLNPNQRIPPLWERLPSAFAYGLRSSPLIVAAILGVASLLLVLIMGGLGLIPVYAMMFKYAFAALQQTAEGELQPPRLDWDVLVNGYELPAKLFFIVVLFVLLMDSIGSKFGAVALLLVLVLGTLAFPAVTMVLAQTGSLLSAINPVLLMTAITRIGWAYLVLLVFTLLLGAGEGAVGELVESAKNPYVAIFGIVLVGSYFTTITFHMIGYVLLQSHERLGEEAPAALRPDIEEQRLAVFQGFMEGGNTDAAIAELESLLRETPRDLGLHRRLHNLLLANQKTDALVRHTRQVIPFLLEQGHADKAAEFYLDCTQHSTDCAPGRSDLYAPLTQALRARGRSRDAALLVKPFNARFAGDDPSRPEFYLLLAQLLAEDLNRDDQARKALQLLLKTFPDHPLRPEVEQYLTILGRVG